MNKKGFISTGIVLALFVLFITLMLMLLTTYSTNRKLLNKQKEDIKNSFKFNIQEKKYLKINDYLFELNIVDGKKIITSAETILITDDVDYKKYVSDWIINNIKNQDIFEQDYYNDNNLSLAGYIKEDEGIKIVMKLKDNVDLINSGTRQDPYLVMEGQDENVK